MAFFEHGRNRYYYYDAGSGRPVLLLHGLSNSGRAWQDQVTALLQLGHRVIVPDLLGHGVSSDAPAGITPHGQALELLALLEHLGLQSTHLIGLSLGGMIAMELAIQAPGVVEKLIVAGTFTTMKTADRTDMLSEWVETLGQDDGCVKRFETTWPSLVSEAFAASPQGQSTYQAWHAQASAQSASNQIHWCEGMKQYDLSEQLQRIQAPTLVLAGEHDLFSPLSEAEDIAQRIGHAHLATLSGDGHVFNVSNAPAFNRALSDFLREQPAHA